MVEIMLMAFAFLGLVWLMAGGLRAFFQSRPQWRQRKTAKAVRRLRLKPGSVVE